MLFASSCVSARPRPCPERRGDRQAGEFPEQRDLRRGEHAAPHDLLHRCKRAVRRSLAVFVHRSRPRAPTIWVSTSKGSPSLPHSTSTRSPLVPSLPSISRSHASPCASMSCPSNTSYGCSSRARRSRPAPNTPPRREGTPPRLRASPRAAVPSSTVTTSNPANAFARRRRRRSNGRYPSLRRARRNQRSPRA